MSDQNLSYYSHARNELIPFIPKNITHALDVGCGVGNFGQMLRELTGCKVWGVELNKEAAEEAKSKLDFVVNSPFDESIDLKGQKFDCIFFNDVLEHLVSPSDALIHCKKYLAHGGLIICSIPNVLHFSNMWNILTTMDWRYEEAGIMDKSHLRFFSKNSIISLFESCNYKITTLNGINHSVGRKFKLLNFLMLNKLVDMQYIQYVIVAQNIDIP